MLKIIHITPSYKPAFCYGGTTMSVAAMCEGLIKTGINIEVLTTKANGSEELMKNSNTSYLVDGVPVRYFSRITKDHTHFSPTLLIALYKVIKSSKLSEERLVIHIHSWWNLVAMLSTLIGVCMKIPLVVSPRGMITAYTLNYKHTYIKRFLHIILGRYLLSCASIHATSEQEANNIRGYLDKAQIDVIPNVVDLPDLRVARGVRNSKVDLKHKVTMPFKRMSLIQTSPAIESKLPRTLELLFLSRIDRKKGLELLFEALSNLNIPWCLSIAGDGEDCYLSELAHLAIKLKIMTKITWLGHLDNTRKYNALQEHDLLVLISKNENFANVIIESLGVGTPVLISNYVGLAPYILKSGLGWVCKTEADDVLNSLRLIYHDAVKRKFIHNCAPAQILNDFNKNKILKAYSKLYTSSIN
jgi:glycosyltransferase involved in cell wall biosynthesis